MRQFLSSKAYWVAGVLVAVFLLLLLLRPGHGVKFPDGSVLSVVYSRYDNWHPVVYGKVGYAICQILPQNALLPLNYFCHRYLRSPGVLAGFGDSSPTADLWEVELLLAGVDPKRDHPLLSGMNPNLSYPLLRTNLQAIVVGNNGNRYTNSIMMYPGPKRRRMFTTTLLTYPMDDVVTIEIWKEGTNAVCRLPVRNPIIRVLKEN